MIFSKIIQFVSKSFSFIFGKFKSLTLKKKAIVIILILLILIISSNIIFKKPAGSEYILAKASLTDITETVSESGTVLTNGKTEVFSPTNGVVENVYVKNNEIVSTGQELFTVISNASEQEQQMASSNYLLAKTTLDNANATAFQLRSNMYSDWDKFYSLSTGDKYENSDGTAKNTERDSAEFQTSQDNWKSAEKLYLTQETAIQQAQAGLNSAWLLYQATQNAIVKAPIAGIITNLSVSSGKNVNIKLQTQSGPVLIITNKADTEIEISLTESDILKIAPNQKVDIKITAIKDSNYKGVISRVDTIGTDKLGVIRYKIYIKVLNPDDKIRPGMSADALITTKIKRNVLAVPNSAIKPYQGGKAVRIYDYKNNKIKYVPVIIGVRGNDKSEIISGVKNNQEIIKSFSNDQIKRPGLLGN